MTAVGLPQDKVSIYLSKGSKVQSVPVKALPLTVLYIVLSWVTHDQIQSRPLLTWFCYIVQHPVNWWGLPWRISMKKRTARKINLSQEARLWHPWHQPRPPFILLWLLHLAPALLCLPGGLKGWSWRLKCIMGKWRTPAISPLSWTVTDWCRCLKDSVT